MESKNNLKERVAVVQLLILLEHQCTAGHNQCYQNHGGELSH